MKKIVFAGLLIFLCITMTACTATDPDNLFEIELGNTIASTPENPSDTTASVPEDTRSYAEDIMYYTGKYQYGNMQNGGDFMLFGNEVVFSNFVVSNTGYQNFDRVYSYDLIRNEVRSFCKDATCTHKKCANSPSHGLMMEVYKGKLYGINEDDSVIEVNANGTKIVTDAPVFFEFFHHDDKLYARTSDSALVVFEAGKKEPQVVVEEYTGRNAVVFDDYLYADGEMSFIRVNLTAEEPKAEEIVPNAMGITDGKHIYYVDMKTMYLYRCDMDGSNAQLLAEKPVLRASMNFDDKYFYFRFMKEMDYEFPDPSSIPQPIPGVSSEEEWDQYDKEMDKWEEECNQYNYERLSGSPDCYDLYRFPKEDPTQFEKIATLPHPPYQVFTVPGTGKLFIITYAPVGEEDCTYIMETDGSNPTKLEIPEY